MSKDRMKELETIGELLERMECPKTTEDLTMKWFGADGETAETAIAHRVTTDHRARRLQQFLYDKEIPF